MNLWRSIGDFSKQFLSLREFIASLRCFLYDSPHDLEEVIPKPKKAESPRVSPNSEKARELNTMLKM